MLVHERELWAQGLRWIAGVDEVGRGPLAGPVVAAAIAIPVEWLEREENDRLAGLTDSKKLTPARRAHFSELLNAEPLVRIGLGVVAAEEIDSLNILRATHLAMAKALRSLVPPAQHALVDGLPVPGLPCPSTAIVQGDAKSLSIAAASVIAKVYRDAMMDAYDVRYPGYGFASHKGYGSRAHFLALMEYGPTPIHRRSFRPVRESLALRTRRDSADGIAPDA